jgi:MscS family membrane protein
MSTHGRCLRLLSALLVLLLYGSMARAQAGGVPASAQGGGSASGQTGQKEAPKDTLGRETPRGTLLGFMNAARAGRDDVTPLYLNTRLRGRAAIDLAQKLFVVLDRRLPARLSELSDQPAGSLADTLKPDQNVIGTISTNSGPIDVVVERVTPRGAAAPVWLFAETTLDAIPDAFDEVNLVPLDRFLPDFLTKPRIAGIRLAAWAALCLILPVGYRVIDAAGGFFSWSLTAWRRRRGRAASVQADLVPGFVRLLLLALLIRWLVGTVELALPERVFWSSVEIMLVIAAAVWVALLLVGRAETYVYRRVRTARPQDASEIAALLRFTRRIAEGLVVAAGVIVFLKYFGVDPTAALAGLGIGGIAVALSAQKTLENVIGGVSIVFDKAVRVGDFVRVGDTLGTVDSIGLRSTRIRTLDRTILSVPNGQIATVNVETLSDRDKFWFHHFLGLRYETTSAQMRAIIDGIRAHLTAHPRIDRGEAIRVRFFRLGPFSLDVEIFAYVLASDWEAFLETQQQLLLDVMEIVESAGAAIAFPTQTMHVAGAAVEPAGLPVSNPHAAVLAGSTHNSKLTT